MGKKTNAGRFECGYPKVTTENLTSWTLSKREKPPKTNFQRCPYIDLSSGSGQGGRLFWRVLLFLYEIYHGKPENSTRFFMKFAVFFNRVRAHRIVRSERQTRTVLKGRRTRLEGDIPPRPPALASFPGTLALAQAFAPNLVVTAAISRLDAPALASFSGKAPPVPSLHGAPKRFFSLFSPKRT